MTAGMISAPSVLMAAQAVEDVPNFPLGHQIACAILLTLFVWAFSVARSPRGWRRLYQAKFTRKEDFSVNRNKYLDENIRKYGIPIAMAFLVAAVFVFVLGVTHRYRHTKTAMHAPGQAAAVVQGNAE